MTGPQPSDHAAEMIQKVRRQRGWSTQDVAKMCANAGAPQITAAVLMNIESGRRGEDGARRRLLSVEELLILGYALGVAPVDLLVPADRSDDNPYKVTPVLTVASGRARVWIGGHGFLSQPSTSSELAHKLQWMPKVRAEIAMREWLDPANSKEIDRG